MQEFYCPEKIEKIVQKYWETNKTFKVKEDFHKKKYYCLSMLPYPSGHLHIGHVRNYTITDVIARYQRMLGKNVLHPIGWDAFGLPAESAALKNNISPSKWTKNNINYMKYQLKSLGFSYDWDREICTCNPKYYRWEQWFFIYLYNKDLVYKKTAEVNWCKQDQTVLANEQVINGRCWRCDTKVENKNIPQWFLKITDYADELLYGLDKLDHWPKKVKIMQKNWIGRSVRLQAIFKIIHSELKLKINILNPSIFMGATYISLTIKHPIALELSKNNLKIYNFINTCKTNKIKKSFESIEQQVGINTDLYIVHPLNKKKIPIWIVNFIMIEDNLKAKIAVPGHNQYDYIFAKKYNLPIKFVVYNINNNKNNNNMAIINIKKGILYNSGKFDGLNYKLGGEAITKKLLKLNVATNTTYYRLRDWNISRQRSWGTPIPMLTLKNGSIIPVPINQLPVLLKNDLKKNNVNNILTSSLKKDKITYLENEVSRETDTFDTFIESSWYYARYTCPNYHNGMINSISANYWLPIDQYVGGIEHATMHLIYFRFYHKLLRDAGFIKSNEPAKRLLCQGMVLADAFYYHSTNGERIWVNPIEVNIERDKNGKLIKATDKLGRDLTYIGTSKMSKSRNNGVDPQNILKKYGSDTLRLFIMFAAPPDMTLIWKESGVEGMYRFLNRLWKLVYEHVNKGVTDNLNIEKLNKCQKKLWSKVNETIIKVTNDIEHRQSFNTAIAAIMELMKKLIKAPQNTCQDRSLITESLNIVIKILYPFSPHICFILWKELGNTSNIDDVLWPIVNKSSIINNKNIIIIQINGKTRKKIVVPINSSEDIVKQTVLKDILISKYINKKKIRKIIYLPGKLMNLVVY